VYFVIVKILLRFMLKEIVIAFQSYAEAHRFIIKHRLWKWIVIPAYRTLAATKEKRVAQFFICDDEYHAAVGFIFLLLFIV
jgi:hypothetical protein